MKAPSLVFLTTPILLLIACAHANHKRRIEAPVVLNYLAPGQNLASPDMQWEVQVLQHKNADDLVADFVISPYGSLKTTILAQNIRNFGAAWSPDSKTLLVYNNMFSGSSGALIFRHAPDGWRQVYSTPDGFHVIWRLDEWLPNGVRLHSIAGGSERTEVPSTVTVPL